MPFIRFYAAPISAAFLLLGCGDSSTDHTDETVHEGFDWGAWQRAAGDTTTDETGAFAFEQHVTNMRDAQAIRDFNIGNDFFKNPWVPSRSSTSSRDGLGPMFNNNSCQGCHIRDGRGHAPEDGALSTNDTIDFNSVLLRVKNLEAKTDSSALGGQVQHLSNTDTPAEATITVSYEYSTFTYPDGDAVVLRRPKWQVTSLFEGDGAVIGDADVFSPRVASPMIGLGLLALISSADIEAKEDPEDNNKDGISGRANRVFSQKTNNQALGRFGWKAGQPNVEEQVAGAFHGDKGLTSKWHPQENCLAWQIDCINAVNGNGDSVGDYPYEVSDTILQKVVFYSQHLAVPSREIVDQADVEAGRMLFLQVGCEACHTETYTTVISDTLPYLSSQVIYPYTDLLLHDMGEALTDRNQHDVIVYNQANYEGVATASEWRTPPLWGIG